MSQKVVCEDMNEFFIYQPQLFFSSYSQRIFCTHCKFQTFKRSRITILFSIRERINTFEYLIENKSHSFVTNCTEFLQGRGSLDPAAPRRSPALMRPRSFRAISADRPSKLRPMWLSWGFISKM